MKTPDFFKKQEDDKQKEIIRETKQKLEEFFEQNVKTEQGCDAKWGSQSSVDKLVVSTVENELRKNGWKGTFWQKEEYGWSMTAKSETRWTEAWLKIEPLTKEESVLIR